jgi:hypothetical protein
MLREWLACALTPAPQTARTLGLVRESIALEARYRRVRRAWAEHLAQSRRFLLDSLATLPRGDTALVIGSGPLLDIPIEDIARRFDRVLLVDLVHPPRIRRALKRWPHVQAITHDITESLDSLAHAPSAAFEEWLTRSARHVPQRFVNDGRIQWVASVNLLSQLPLPAMAHIARQRPELSPRLEDWALSLMHNHLHYLAAFEARGAHVALLADRLRLTLDREGHPLIEEPLDAALAPVTGPARASAREWDWPVAPKGELPEGLSQHHRVFACHGGLFHACPD